MPAHPIRFFVFKDTCPTGHPPDGVDHYPDGKPRPFIWRKILEPREGIPAGFVDENRWLIPRKPAWM